MSEARSGLARAALLFCFATFFFGISLPVVAETLRGALVRAYAGNPALNAERASLRATDENVPRALAVVAMEVVRPRLGREAVVATLATSFPEPRMDVHQNARTTPHSRMLIVERLDEGWTVPAIAAAMGVDPKTVRKWRDRFAAEGAAGLVDRSSRPHRSPTRLGEDATVEIERLRRERLSGPAIARQARRPVSTVGAWLRRLGLGRLSALDPKPPVIRYERERPGELIHIDTKKLGRIDGIGHRITGHRTGMVRNRGIGWDHLHVAVDDASRLAYTELLPDDRKESAIAFLQRAPRVLLRPWRHGRARDERQRLGLPQPPLPHRDG